MTRPGSCIRRLAGTRAREMQFTRFLRNDSVGAAEMSVHAGAATAQRVAGRDVVALQDTSALKLGGQRARANGYGPAGKGGGVRGILLHPVLAVDAGTGAVLGLVDMQVWNRDQGKKVSARSGRRTDEKESQRWLDGAARAGEVLVTAKSITVIGDRESDIFELYVTRPANVHLIARASQNRQIKTPTPGKTKLFSYIDGLPVQSRFMLTIPAAPGRAARVANMALRFAPVVLRRPKNGAARDLPKLVELTCVDIRETSKPKNGPRVHWRLLTTHQVTSLDDGRRIIELYRQRWTIEEYFHTLKTAGFDIENADISDPQAMIKLTAAAAVAAVTVMQLVRAREGKTGQSLADAFDPADQPVLEALSAKLEGKTERQQNPHRRGTLAFAAWTIGRLGGWTGYYGKPGPRVMRRGLDDFQRIKYGVTLEVQNV